MSRLRRPAKPVIVLLAFIGLALSLSACTYYKAGSLALSQPGAIGSARVHFVICTEPEGTTCNPPEETVQVQVLVGIAVPPGSTPPATLTAVPLGGGAPLTFTRNDEVSAEMAAASVNLEKFAKEAEVSEEGTQAWPPTGLQGVGYLSAPFQETEGVTQEWTVDADFGLPVPSDGGAFAGPFGAALAFGQRGVSPAQPANRPVRCYRFEAEPQENEAFCAGTSGQGQIGTSDLKITPAAQTTAFLGGKGTLSFPLNFASTAAALPSFNLAATSTLPKASVKPASPTFTPGVPDATTHRSPLALGTVNVRVPKNAKPGLYDVTLTATTAQGASVSQVAKLKVAKAKIKLAGLKLNKAKGTAILSVKVPAAGALTVSGKGLVKKKAKAKKAKTLKILIKPNAKTKALLAEAGKAKVKAKISFKPTGAAPFVKSKSIVLKQS
ncbi:MAG TPA: hypothetical protein VFZ19_06800 [Solirubrobacterales bacterium]